MQDQSSQKPLVKRLRPTCYVKIAPGSRIDNSRISIRKLAAQVLKPFLWDRRQLCHPLVVLSPRLGQTLVHPSMGLTWNDTDEANAKHG